MIKQTHGGDIYRNHDVIIDFSVNGNPKGIPQTVREAIEQAAKASGVYPDPCSCRLKEAIAGLLNEFYSPASLTAEEILCGNGASELFMAIVHALQPGRIVIPVPSFYGYEHAARALPDGMCRVEYVPLRDHDFAVTKSLCGSLTDENTLLFLANPNNPTGKSIPRETLLAILEHSRKKNIYVVLDECFVGFLKEDCSMIRELERFPNLMVVRAFTKIFGMPGVRLGYLATKNRRLRLRIAEQLPEWNLSVFAQAAGIAAAGEKEYLTDTPSYVEKERRFLAEQLGKHGQIQVISGEADFLFLYSRLPLYELLLRKGILIRDCSNYRGLGEAYYRIAVKTREENELLLQALPSGTI